MLRFYEVSRGIIKGIDPEGKSITETFQRADWIDAHEPSDEERTLLEKLVHPDLPESAEMEEIEASARFFVDPAGIHVHSLFLTHSEGRHHTVSVASILQPSRLITIRNDEPADFRLLRMRARRGQIESRSPAELLITLLGQKVENLADSLEDIHHQLERASYVVLEEENADLEDAIDLLAKLEDSSGKIRLCLMDTQRAIAFLQRHLKDGMELQEMCREVMRDIDTLMSHTTFLFEKINFLMDSTQGFINIQQNQIIKIFSIAAVVFLPPTLVASIYGMNFEFMPELEWLLGYPWALGLMVISGIAPYLLFKRKGWL
ncbi:magnesium/cobalt transporter CorA [Proteobacteria bacterium 005FR1]|nr:magnesium/cobalt transporter CorA [Proteobacteria bacterium 005FR1]